MAAHSILAVAVATNKAGYVFLADGAIQDWGTFVKPTKNTILMVGFAQELINQLKPDVVVCEKCATGCRKGTKSKQLIEAIAEVASHNPVLDIRIKRPRKHQSKYEEASALAAAHDVLKPYLPKRKRRFFDFEPRNMIIFEAAALAQAVHDNAPTQFAAAKA